MLRIILGCIAGVFVAIGLTAILQAVGHMIFPVPEGMNTMNRAEMGEAIAALPITSKVSVIVSYTIAALVGGGLAAWISKRKWAALIIVGFMLAATAVNLIMIPHPLWMIFATIAGLLFAGVFAQKAAEFGAATAKA